MTPYFSSSEPRYVARAVRVNAIAIANSRNATVTANRHVPEIRRYEAETWGYLLSPLGGEDNATDGKSVGQMVVQIALRDFKTGARVMMRGLHRASAT
jgi:hypothetical protein